MGGHDQPDLNQSFAAARGQLRAVAFRMLGSMHEADDALQEAWLRASRSQLHAPAHSRPGLTGSKPLTAAQIDSIPAWLTTIVSRVCLDMLRARRRRAEVVLDMDNSAASASPEEELAWVQEVGSALLVVMNTLGPAERIAFVLHDLLGRPFEEIARVLERSPVATKKLASRARARVIARPAERLEAERAAVAALLRATRERDVDGMLAVLAPDVVRRSKQKDQPPTELHGPNAFTRDALRNAAAARSAELVLIDGHPGLIVAPHGRLTTALRFSVSGERITMMEVITEPAALDKLELRVLELSSHARGSATQ